MDSKVFHAIGFSQLRASAQQITQISAAPVTPVDESFVPVGCVRVTLVHFVDFHWSVGWFGVRVVVGPTSLGDKVGAGLGSFFIVASDLVNVVCEGCTDEETARFWLRKLGESLVIGADAILRLSVSCLLYTSPSPRDS